MRAVALIALVMLTSAAHADERPSFVPPPAAGEERLDNTALRALMVDGAIECSSYEASSNTCEGISVYLLRDGVLINSGLVVLSVDPDIRFSIEAAVEFAGDATCIDLTTADIRVTAPSLGKERMADLMRVVNIEARKSGRVCGVYSRAQNGEFTTRAWQSDGEELSPLDKSLTRFLSKDSPTPSLRQMKIAPSDDS